MARAELRGAAGLGLRLLAEAVQTAARQMGSAVPAEARLHLIRAQRELLLAAVAALEHRERDKPAAGRGSRVRKIPLD